MIEYKQGGNTMELEDFKKLAVLQILKNNPKSMLDPVMGIIKKKASKLKPEEVDRTYHLWSTKSDPRVMRLMLEAVGEIDDESGAAEDVMENYNELAPMFRSDIEKFIEDENYIQDYLQLFAAAICERIICKDKNAFKSTRQFIFKDCPIDIAAVRISTKEMRFSIEPISISVRKKEVSRKQILEARINDLRNKIKSLEE